MSASLQQQTIEGCLPLGLFIKIKFLLEKVVTFIMEDMMGYRKFRIHMLKLKQSGGECGNDFNADNGGFIYS